MIRKITILFYILFYTVMIAHSQGFKGSAVLGFNASQIDGDDLYGYNKVGLTGGIRIGYPVMDKADLNLEFLFSQRGSQADLSFSDDIRRISLNYIEIPVVFSYKDWLIEEDGYYKVRAEAGLSYGYLFDVSTSNGGFDGTVGDFRRDDISLILGAGYRLNRRWSFTARYTRGLRKIYYDADADVDGFLSYFITLRSEFNF